MTAQCCRLVALLLLLGEPVLGSITRFVTNLNDSGTGSLRDTIATSTSGAQIRWTIDGSAPSPTNGTLINPNNPVASFTVGSNQTKTLKAIAYKTGMTNSNIKSANYTFERECGDDQVLRSRIEAKAAKFVATAGRHGGSLRNP